MLEVVAHDHPTLTVTLTHDAGRRLLTASTSYTDSAGVVRTRTSARYDYDASGRLRRVVTDLTPDDNSIVDGQVSWVGYEYDAAARLKRITASAMSPTPRTTSSA